MGRFKQKVILMLAALAISVLPMSVSLAAIDCMFHGESNAPLHDDLNIHDHDSLLLDIGDVTLVDVAKDIGPDQGCSMKLICAAAVEPDLDYTSIWSNSFQNSDTEYQIKVILLPTEIRPPIV